MSNSGDFFFSGVGRPLLGIVSGLDGIIPYIDSWLRSRGIDPEEIDDIEQEYRKNLEKDNG
jgi:hypothetical protein